MITNNNNDKKSVTRSTIAKSKTSKELNPINSFEITRKNSLIPMELGVTDKNIEICEIML